MLKNLIGATTTKQLNAFEADIVPLRQIQLLHTGWETSGDFHELQYIHFALFHDIYSWAGEPRTIDIQKNAVGSIPFFPVAKLEDGISNAFAQLKSDGYLRNLNTQDFVERLAFHYEQLNYLHPFREGNGRAQRVFWSRVARDAGHNIDWTQLTREDNDRACMIAMRDLNLQPLIQMFSTIVR
ncbi:cell filamentation protein [Arcanobacterium wilhelmae]|uniref:protein adenylyltransferase n=1 Tax=Arcanobacterium wilhelmae TaxID=1803177 RepID=A0ABT9N9H3_9ACTO|nr:Fic family protein [Arcanobacterium wilhelmae]MDP9800350.1 cell filamentation protein [Arcanobacterium wilhelmae]WFN89786.1 Fic family protein [Arcanobacterium wilhelmae]